MSIKIITASLGPTTTEMVLQLILAHPKGLTAKEICRSVNRPISMVQICLKDLKSSRQVTIKTSNDGKCLIYYPRSCS